MLILVRHGQSTANAEDRWCGQMDAELTPEGVGQARNTGRELAKTRFDSVWTSELIRSVNTARLILDENYHAVPQFHSLAGLNERSDGDLEGKTFDETIQDFPRRKWLEWKRDYFVAPPGGESYAEVAERVIPILHDRILPHVRDNQTALVVTHSGVMRVMFGYLQGLEEQEVPKIQIEHATPYFFTPRD